MIEYYRCDPDDIRAAMGPSIHACCYEVSEEIGEIVLKNFGERYMNGRSLDLQALNLDFLTKKGLRRENIEIDAICTCCDSDYFSYRREGVTGRSAGVIWIEA